MKKYSSVAKGVEDIFSTLKFWPFPIFSVEKNQNELYPY